MLTVDFARYYRANNGDNMNTQFNKNSLLDNKNYDNENFNCKNLKNGKTKGNAISKNHRMLKSTVMLVSWLFVFILSLMLVYLTNINNNNLSYLNNVDAVADALIGSGTQESPYLISSESSLKILSEENIYWGTSSKPIYVKLTANIEYTYDTWTPIGNSTNKFYGNFDGGGHTITYSNDSGVTLQYEDNYGGLFGFVNNSTIQNIGVIWQNTAKATSNSVYVGGIVGQVEDSIISGCYVSGILSIDGYWGVTYLGGIAGNVIGVSQIKNCYNLSNLEGETMADGALVGGIVGHINGGTIKNCYNTGKIYAYCDSSGTGHASGIAASSYNSNIINCFSLVGSSKAPSANGTINGIGGSGTVTKCYYDYPSSNGGLGTRKTTSALTTLIMTKSNYSSSSNWSITADNKWNFDEVWNIDTSTTDPINSGYPYLRVFYNYVVSYDITTNGGTGTTPKEETVSFGASVTLPAPSSDEYKKGWTFIGWSENANSTTTGILSSPYTPTSSVTLYAIYSKIISANFYQLNGSNSIKTTTIYNNATNGSVTAPAVSTSSVEGSSQVVGWATSTTSTISSVTPNTNINISGNENYYAVVSCVITIDYNGNGATNGQVSNSTGTIYKTANGTTTPTTKKAEIKLNQNAFTKDNYTFIGWSIKSSTVNPEYESGISYEFESDTTLYAIWKSNSLAVNFSITSNIGAILIISDVNGNIQQVFINQSTSGQKFTLNLMAGEYKVIISTLHTTNIELTTANTNQVLSGKLITLNVTGEMNVVLKLQSYVGNNWVMI